MLKKRMLTVMIASSLIMVTLGGCATTFNVNKTDDNDVSYSDETSLAEDTGVSEDEMNYDIAPDTVHVYYEGKFGSEEEDLQMYFLNGNKQIPYYDMDTIKHVMEKVYNGGYGDYEKDTKYQLNYSIDGNKVTFEREDTYDMVIDFDEDTIYFTDYDVFIAHSYDMTTVDLSHSSGFDENQNPIYLKRVEDKSSARYGCDITFDLGAYNIDLIASCGGFYIPAQTIADILIASTYTRFVYNGEAAFFINDKNLKADIYENSGYGALIYANLGKQRSQELIDFTYNELCMALDYEYGLKESHDIDTFDLYFKELSFNGKSLKKMLCSEDTVEMEQAIKYLVKRGFDDIHSNYYFPGTYISADKVNEIYMINDGPSNEQFGKIRSEYKFERHMNLMDENFEIPGYQEIGNTAYVTFDAFTPPSMDYYANPPMDDDAPDTVGLLLYAHSQIKRMNSPIENVVLDLSCNTGGAEDAVAFVCSWFLQDAQIFLKNPLTGASSVNVYECDANLDHQFDESDCLSDYNLYCLISPVSFSCGNLAPCMFDCSQKVTLIGQKTGGGSSIILPMTTASGTIFQISGYRVISSMKNGSFYDADQGVEPDVVLTKKESFYNREELTEFINSLK